MKETHEESMRAANDKRPPTRLRILMVSAQFLPIMGGAEMHTYEVGRRLSALGHVVTVLTTDSGRQLPTSEVIEGMRVVRVRSWTPNTDLFFAPGIAHYIRSHANEWDVVHCQGWHNLVPPMAMIGAILSRLPFLVTFHSGGHSSRLRMNLRGVQRLAFRPLFARASMLIGVSRFESQLFQKSLRLDARKFVTIPNGSQLPVVEPQTETPGLIVSIGRLERYKGHHRIIEAMPQVIDRIPEAHLLILGSGPYSEALHRLVRQHGLEARVQITSIPPDDRGKLARTLSRAALVTLLSDYEAHPISMMEALAARRKLLVTYTSGLAELVDQGLADGVPLDSRPDDIARAVVDAMNKPAMKPDVPLPSWEQCTSRVLSLYQFVAGSESPP